MANSVENSRGGEREQEQRLQARLVEGDPLAPSEFAEEYLPPLVDWLVSRFRAIDQHLLETVAIDSVLRLAKEPRRYDPTRGGLSSYLRMDARGDVRNALKAQQRQGARRVPLEAVEVGPTARKLAVEKSTDPAELVLNSYELPSSRLADLCADLKPADRAVLDLISEGERRTSAYARILGITELPDQQQAREVKRAKDRLMKRLKRRAGRVERWPT